MLKAAVASVLQDDMFKVPSSSATDAVCSASELSVWCNQPEHEMELNTFATSLVSKLQSCLGLRGRSVRVRMEMMWGSFHKLRTTPEFSSVWGAFFTQSINQTASPVLI